MVASIVDAHVPALRHMAIDTEAATRLWPMAMVVEGVESGWKVALVTQRIAGQFYLSTMGFMTISATYAFLIHFTLQKRAKHEDFVLNLSIRKV